MKINSLEDLERDKQRLRTEAHIVVQNLNNDFKLLKKALEPLELIRRWAISVVPEAIRHSKIVNGPINFIAKTIFHEPRDVVKETSDSGTGNQIRDVALGVLETAASFLVSRYIRKKF